MFKSRWGVNHGIIHNAYFSIDHEYHIHKIRVKTRVQGESMGIVIYTSAAPLPK
jgi:hypothetical protein